MGFELEVDNYRALRRIRWKANGVCALVGPNGSGKTTLLSVLQFLRRATVEGFGKALSAHGGAFLFKHWQAAANEPVRFALTSGVARWEAEPSTRGPGVVEPVPERLIVGQEVVAEQRAGEASFRLLEENKILGDQGFLSAVSISIPNLGDLYLLLACLASPIFYSFDAFWQLKRDGSREGTDVKLNPDGRNVFTVLRNWIAGKREHRPLWEWVRNGLRECFPDLFDDLDFAVAGQTVAAQFYGPRGGDPTPMHLAPNGLLMALLSLCAVASGEDDEVICIDEPENGLHPYAIQRLVALMRERAELHRLTIVLATHSPTLLNEFNGQLDHVFIMEPGHESLPVRLDQHQNPEWLRNFALGDLYMNQTIAPQVPPKT
ncbi:AAA family ATPase [Cystobacter fuscus]|uniref:AAA family ATPase n=1 Tax=Cystobacter fuscus TaxID=43 RepID=UPI002B2CB390|nr:AAA family ATPase [Cystobacter fuscus]